MAGEGTGLATRRGCALHQKTKCRHSGHRAAAMPIPIETMSSSASVSPMKKRCMGREARLAVAGAMIAPRGRP